MPKSSIFEEKIFKFILNNPGINAKKLANSKNKIGCCERTIYYNLKNLIEKGKIKKGEGNLYYPTDVEKLKERIFKKEINEFKSFDIRLTEDLSLIYYFNKGIEDLEGFSPEIKNFIKILFLEKIPPSKNAIKNFFLRNYNKLSGEYSNDEYNIEFNIFNINLPINGWKSYLDQLRNNKMKVKWDIIDLFVEIISFDYQECFRCNPKFNKDINSLISPLNRNGFDTFLETSHLDEILSESLRVYFTSNKEIQLSNQFINKTQKILENLMHTTILSPDILMKISTIKDLNFSFIVSFGYKEIKGKNLNILKSHSNGTFFDDLRKILNINDEKKNIENMILKDYYHRKRKDDLIEKYFKKIDKVFENISVKRDLDIKSIKEETKRWLLQNFSQFELRNIKNFKTLDKVMKIIYEYTLLMIKFCEFKKVEILSPRCISNPKFENKPKLTTFYDALEVLKELEMNMIYKIEKIARSKGIKVTKPKVKQFYYRELNQFKEKEKNRQFYEEFGKKAQDKGLTERIKNNRVIDILKENLKYFDLNF